MEKGDNVLIRGVFNGPHEVRPEDNYSVDVFSNSTQYTVMVRREDVAFYGPDWWPPREGDVVIAGAVPWQFFRRDGRMFAFTASEPGDQIEHSLVGAEQPDAESWRGSFLVVRDGELTV